MAKSTLITGITATGQEAINTADAGGASMLVLQNVGTVPLTVYFNDDGSGAPSFVLRGGTVNDDGNGDVLTDSHWHGPLWVKAPAGGGRALAGTI